MAYPGEAPLPPVDPSILKQILAKISGSLQQPMGADTEFGGQPLPEPPSVMAGIGPPKPAGGAGWTPRPASR